MIFKGVSLEGQSEGGSAQISPSLVTNSHYSDGYFGPEGALGSKRINVPPQVILHATDSAHSPTAAGRNLPWELEALRSDSRHLPNNWRCAALTV